MSEDGSDSSDLNKSTNPPGTGTRSSVAGTGGAATPPDIVMKHAPGSWQALAAGQITSDGRNVDTRRAELSGEGADLDAGDRVGDRGHLGDPSQTTVAEESSKRVVKASRWTWEVPAYFAIGGMAGAAATLSAGAQLAKLGGTDRRMVQSGRVIALGGTAVGSVLLVADLGRPERFWHMLRVFRPSSPMNVGSWVLAGFGTASAGAAVLGRSRSRQLRFLGDAAGLTAGVLGLPMAGYTGVLLGATAQPAWWHARRWLPRLFVASAASAGAGALELIPMSPAEERAVRTFAIGARAADLVVVKAMTRDLADHPEVADAYEAGRAGRRMKAAEALTACALAASVASIKVRALRPLAGALGLAGSLATRLAVTDAGASSTQPV